MESLSHDQLSGPISPVTSTKWTGFESLQHFVPKEVGRTACSHEQGFSGAMKKAIGEVK
jgi:hypothetical protein